MSKKILITGASGIIGESLIRHNAGSEARELLLVSRKSDEFGDLGDILKFNAGITEKAEIKRICLDMRPDVIINCASYSNPQKCEKHKKLAWDINVDALENLTRMARIVDAHLISFSSDNIFPGDKGPYSETDRPEPINYYGKSKHAADNTVLAGCERSTIIRMSGVFGYSSFGRQHFLNYACESFRNNKDVTYEYETKSNPVFADDLANAVYSLIDRELYGIFNAGSPDILTKKEMASIAKEIFESYDSKITLVKNKTANTVNIPAKAGLITLKLETNIGMRFSDIENALQALKYQMLENRNFTRKGDNNG